jgi:F0F1-type ATP synthase membrane subunit b/b'
MEMSVNENATRRPGQFLADLTLAMSATAATARQATIDQCRTDAEARKEQLRSGQEDDALAMRKAAEADVAAIREWSKAEMDHTRTETEERIALRRRRLEGELEAYDSAIEIELRRVAEQIEAWQADLTVFFDRLLQDSDHSDPTTFAALAAQMPDPPSFEEPDPSGIVRSLRAANGDPSADGGSDGRDDGLPDHWWMESPAALAARARSMAGSSQTS